MQIRNLKRRILKSLALATCLAAGLLLTMPLWFGWLLHPTLARFNVSYQSYERIGWGRFALRELQCTLPSVNLKSERLEITLPPSWLWRVYFGNSQDTRPFVAIDTWELEIKPQPAREPTPATPLPEGFQSARDAIRLVQHWMPRFVARQGTVIFDDQTVLLPRIALENSMLSIETAAPEPARAGRLLADLGNPAAPTLDITLPELNFGTTLAITATDSSVSVSGRSTFEQSPFEWSVDFGAESTLPLRAKLDYPSFPVPSKWLANTPIGEAAASLQIAWQDNQLKLNLNAEAWKNDSSEPALESIHLALEANVRGDVVSLTKTALHTSSLHMETIQPLRFDLALQRLAAPTEIRVTADPAQQRWIQADGHITGTISLAPRDTVIPRVEFELLATDLGNDQAQLPSAGLSGRLDWPILELAKGSAALGTGGTATLATVIDLEKRFIQSGSLGFKGRVDQKWMPEGITHESLSVSSQIQGPLDRPEHSGTLRIGKLEAPGLKPIDLVAQWQGTLLDIAPLTISLKSTDAALELAASTSRTNQQFAVRLDRLTLNRLQETLLESTDPAEIRIEPAATANPTWQLVSDPLRLAGKDRSVELQVELQHPERGVFSAELKGLSSAMVAGFLSAPPPDVHLDRLSLSGGWTNGPVAFLLDTLVRTPVNQFTVSTRLAAAGTRTGLALTTVQISNKDGPVLDGSGHLPLTIHPADAAEPVHWDRDESMELRLDTRSNPSFWTALSTLVGVTLAEPTLKLEVSGSLAQPMASLSVQTQSLGASAERLGAVIPPLTDLKTRVELDPKRLALTTFLFKFQDQQVSATGEVPIHLEAKTPLGIVLPEEVRARLTVANASLREIARAFPEHLSPQGTLDLNLELLPGFMAHGELSIEGAGSRPLPSIGSIQDIGGRIGFEGRKVGIESLSGSVGGSPVTVSGSIDFAPDKLRGQMPLLHIHIRSENTPLVRQPQMMLRTDLNLTISNATNETPVVSGVVQLRDSFFLSDISALQSGGVSSPSRRPPYFSVDSPAVGDWLLHLRVEGEEFMRIQTPVFRGRASTHLDLQSTLREPIALGDVTLNSGTIEFPFAKLRITQGFVTLTSENPYTPQLLITARSPVFGYDVTMSVTGTADQPVVELSSTPSLSSEQIMLMMTAGELPQREITFTSRQKATSMGMFLGKGLLSKFSSGNGTAEKLTVRSGEYISSEGKQTYSVEYKLTDHWSVVGEYDRFSEFNADVKWKFYSK
ncbi:MAG: translocation/assembly module TamB [Verrucomicrobia bacterium]|nr:translocation/assembly module TamB [Verrucomicrobiota bacterium]